MDSHFGKRNLKNYTYTYYIDRKTSEERFELSKRVSNLQGVNIIIL